MRRRVLCGRWARLAFPEKKKAVVVAWANRRGRQKNSCLPCPARRLLFAARRYRRETVPGAGEASGGYFANLQAALTGGQPSYGWEHYYYLADQSDVSRTRAVIIAMVA